MNKPQVVVEVMGINWGDSTFDECVDQLVLFWANERGLPYIERIEYLVRSMDSPLSPCANFKRSDLKGIDE